MDIYKDINIIVTFNCFIFYFNFLKPQLLHLNFMLYNKYLQKKYKTVAIKQQKKTLVGYSQKKWSNENIYFAKHIEGLLQVNKSF